MYILKQTPFYTALFAALIFFVVLIDGAQAQHLNIKNTENGKVRTLKTGQKIFLKFSGGEEFSKAKIQSLSDSSLTLVMLDEEEIMLREVKLKEIYSIKKTSCMHKTAQIAGAIAMVGGAGAIFEAPAIAGEDGSDWLVRGTGIAVLAVGLIPYLIKPTEYVQGSNAEFSVVK
jgi:hypothetical protein